MFSEEYSFIFIYQNKPTLFNRLVWWNVEHKVRAKAFISRFGESNEIFKLEDVINSGLKYNIRVFPNEMTLELHDVH